VARLRAKVALTPEARQRSADAHALLWRRRPKACRCTGSIAVRVRAGALDLSGDPLSPANKKFLEARQLAIFQRGALAGLGPEISEEEIVRAMLVVRANT